MTKNDMVVALFRLAALHGTDAVRIKCARCGAMTRLEHMARREMAHDTRLKPICRACEAKAPQAEEIGPETGQEAPQ